MRKANDIVSSTCFKQEDGFSFVEIMVALAILGMAITALVGLLTSNTMVSARAADKSRVTDAVSQLAEQLRAMPYKQAGQQKTYVSNDGVTMNLDVSTSTAEGANVKVITINGVSNHLTPNTKQSLQVVLRNPSMGTDDSGSGDNGGDATVSDPPIIDEFSVNRGTDTLLGEGGLLYGDSRIWVQAHAAKTGATLTSIYLTCNGEPLASARLNPVNGTRYCLDWSSAAKDTSGNSLFKDGINEILLEVKDDQGGYAKQTHKVVIDNDPVVSTFSSSTITVYTTNGISVSWNPITDPANGMGTALRYKIVLTATKRNKSTNYEGYTEPETPGTLPPTNYTFSLGYKNGTKYTVKVYAMCPTGCTHTTTISTSYLSKSF